LAAKRACHQLALLLAQRLLASSIEKTGTYFKHVSLRDVSFVAIKGLPVCQHNAVITLFPVFDTFWHCDRK
jgi:hypothetical protein